MLVLRVEQMVALETVKLLVFEDRLLVHARRYFAAACAELGEAGTREHIHRAVERGRGHGLRSERDLSKFLNLTFRFGSEFDTDPAHAWMSAILNHPGDDPSRRLNRLYDAALAMLKERRADVGAE